MAESQISVIRCLGIKHVSYLAGPNMHTVTSVSSARRQKCLLFGFFSLAQVNLWNVRSFFRRSWFIFEKTFMYCWRPAVFCLLYLILPLQSSNTDVDYPPLPQNPFLSISFTKVKAPQYGNMYNKGCVTMKWKPRCRVVKEETDWMPGRLW